MNEQPTPETDIEHLQFAMGGFTLDFCRKLERERDSARELAQAFHKDQIILLRERDEARDLADRYRVAFCSSKGDLVPQVFPWEEAK